jgi:hypothetical protein
VLLGQSAQHKCAKEKAFQVNMQACAKQIDERYHRGRDSTQRQSPKEELPAHVDASHQQERERKFVVTPMAS